MKYGDIILSEKLLEVVLTLPLNARQMVVTLVAKSEYVKAIAEFEIRRSAIINNESVDEQTKRKAVEELVGSECANFNPQLFTLKCFEDIIGYALAKGNLTLMGKEISVADFGELFYDKLVEK